MAKCYNEIFTHKTTWLRIRPFGRTNIVLKSTIILLITITRFNESHGGRINEHSGERAIPKTRIKFTVQIYYSAMDVHSIYIPRPNRIQTSVDFVQLHRIECFDVTTFKICLHKKIVFVYRNLAIYDLLCSRTRRVVG